MKIKAANRPTAHHPRGRRALCATSARSVPQRFLECRRWGNSFRSRPSVPCTAGSCPHCTPCPAHACLSFVAAAAGGVPLAAGAQSPLPRGTSECVVQAQKLQVRLLRALLSYKGEVPGARRQGEICAVVQMQTRSTAPSLAHASLACVMPSHTGASTGSCGQARPVQVRLLLKGIRLVSHARQA